MLRTLGIVFFDDNAERLSFVYVRAAPFAAVIFTVPVGTFAFFGVVVYGIQKRHFTVYLRRFFFELGDTRGRVFAFVDLRVAHGKIHVVNGGNLVAVSGVFRECKRACFAVCKPEPGKRRHGRSSGSAFQKLVKLASCAVEKYLWGAVGIKSFRGNTMRRGKIFVIGLDKLVQICYLVFGPLLLCG